METRLSPRPQSPTITDNGGRHTSGLYQYHNAPEVAPAHGLEYDDAVYASSDKYPVIHEHSHRSSPPSYKGYDSNNAAVAAVKSPLILFGMKVRTFIMVAVIMVCIIVGAAVGGAVGGRNMHGGNTSGITPISTTTSASSKPQTIVAGPSSTTTATAAVTPTYAPLNDCPSSNGTTYTASLSSANNSSGTNQTFTKYCNAVSPLSSTSSALAVQNITQAFVYSFNDCIAICAGYNSYASSSSSSSSDPGSSLNCTIAVYNPAAHRPTADCWVGNVDVSGLSAGDLTAGSGSGVSVALLLD